MLRNLSIVVAITAAIAIPVSAFAAHVHAHSNVHVNRNVHVNKNVHVDRNVHLNKNVHVSTNNLVYGNRYHGGVYLGRAGRYWHGQWYAYGVGSCWVLTPDDYYVWIC